MNLLEITSQTWIITVVGWCIVFLALVVLIIIFSNIPKLFNIKLPKKSVSKSANDGNIEETGNDYMSGDENAAIAMAIYMYYGEQHDEESDIITIKRIQRRYSPWSSKIYGVMNVPKN